MKKIFKALGSISIILGFIPFNYNLADYNIIKPTRYSQYNINAQNDGYIFGIHGDYNFTAYFQIDITVSPNDIILINDMKNSLKVTSTNLNDNYNLECDVSSVRLSKKDNKLYILYNITTNIDFSLHTSYTSYQFIFEYDLDY